MGDPDPDIGVPPATSQEIHTVSSSEDDMDVVSLSGSPQELLSTGNNDAPVVDIASYSDSDDSVVEFHPIININTVDWSDDDSGLADMVGGPGLDYAEENSETSTSSMPSASSAVLPWTDLRDRTTSGGMSRRQEALRYERSQPQRPRRCPNHQMPDSMRPRPITNFSTHTLVVGRPSSPFRHIPVQHSPVNGYPSQGVSFVRASFDSSSPLHSTSSNRQPGGGRTVSEVRGGGAYWLCSSNLCHHRNWEGRPGGRCGNPGCPTRRS